MFFLTRMAWLVGVAAFAAAAALALQEEASLPGPDAAELSGGAAFTVGGIELDYRASSVEAAREAAFREASRRAWPRLWARLTGGSAESAPQLGDAALDGMIGGIEIERERFANGRYIASLGVVFDRRRAARRLPETARILQSRPMLLVPLLSDAGVTGVFEQESQWNAAWGRFGASSSLIDYVQAPGNLGDQILVNGWQARRSNRDLWRTLLARYRAENILVAEARLRRNFPGGPIDADFYARHGPDSVLLDQFSLRASAPGELADILDEAVRRIDGAYAEALQDGRLRADDSLVIELAPLLVPEEEIDEPEERALIVSVVTPDDATWLSLQTLVSSVPAVSAIDSEQLNIGGLTSAVIRYDGDYERLRRELDRRGVRLEPGDRGLRLRRRVAGDVAIAAPEEEPEAERVDIPVLAPPPPPPNGG